VREIYAHFGLTRKSICRFAAIFEGRLVGIGDAKEILESN
jgi:hypothetical protein